MCNRIKCLCRAASKDVTDLFVALWDANYTAREEAYFDTEPDIAGPLKELDARQRAEKNERNRRNWYGD